MVREGQRDRCEGQAGAVERRADAVVLLLRPQAAKKAALKGTQATALKKVRHSVTFHRCVLLSSRPAASRERRPSRRRRPAARADRVSPLAAPTRRRLNRARRCASPQPQDPRPPPCAQVPAQGGRVAAAHGRVPHDRAPAQHRVGHEEDRGAQHARLHRRRQVEQAPDQGGGQEAVRRQGAQDQHPDPVRRALSVRSRLRRSSCGHRDLVCLR